MKTKIDDATATQLAKFASIQFGIDVAHQKGKDHIVGLLRNVGFTEDEIEIADPEPARAPAAAGAPIEGPRKTVRIVIQKQDIPGGQEAVPVGINGKVDLIRRGEPVEVSAAHIEVLNNAQTIQYDIGPNMEPINPHPVQRFPFSILSS